GAGTPAPRAGSRAEPTWGGARHEAPPPHVVDRTRRAGKASATGAARPAAAGPAVTATALAATLARAPGRVDGVAEPVGNPRFTGPAHSPVDGRAAQTAESAQTLQFAPVALRRPARA